MKKNFNISVPDWILEDVIGKTINRSARIQELLLKGHLYEKQKENLLRGGKTKEPLMRAAAETSRLKTTKDFCEWALKNVNSVKS